MMAYVGYVQKCVEATGDPQHCSFLQKINRLTQNVESHRNGLNLDGGIIGVAICRSCEEKNRFL